MQRPAGVAPLEIPDAVRDRLADEVDRRAVRGRPDGGGDRRSGRVVLAQLTEAAGGAGDVGGADRDISVTSRTEEPPGGAGNTRNGSTAKTLATEQGPVRIETPRDRKGSFEPQIIRKGPARASRALTTRSLALYFARAVDARHRGAPGRDLRGQGRPRLDQPRHRRGDGRRS